jgi:hypothetical protein
LGLRDHPTDKKIYAKPGEQLSSFEGMSRCQRLLLPMLFLLLEDIHKKNPACFIEDRRNAPLP